jgi:hypothetical protein
MNAGPNDKLIVNTIDFLVPCRRFFIKANVTLDRQLPVVDEFVLRLLRISEQISVKRLRRFFGFSEAEVEATVLDLQERSLVAIDGAEIFLTPMGAELFKHEAADGAPRLTEIEVREESVWFELVSKNIMQASRYRLLPNLIPLKEDPRARDLSQAYAREAFELNFRDYAWRFMRHPEADRLSIYSVSDVLPAGFGYQLLRAQVEMVMRDNIELRLTYPSLSDEALKFRDLTSLAADEWELIKPTEKTAGGLEEYERITGDQRPRRLVEKFDPDLWLSLIQVTVGEGLRPMLGPPYLAANIESFCRAVAAAAKAKGKPPTKLDVLWVRPGGGHWGRTLELSDAVTSIRDEFRSLVKTAVDVNLIVPRAVPTELRTVAKKIFDNGLLAPSGQLPSDIEVLLVPDLAACVVIHLPFGSSTLAVGVMLTDPNLLGKLERRLIYESRDKETRSLWGVARSKVA